MMEMMALLSGLHSKGNKSVNNTDKHCKMVISEGLLNCLTRAIRELRPEGRSQIMRARQGLQDLQQRKKQDKD